MTPSLRTDISDPLWVPLLTHYTPEGTVDAARVLAHLRSLHPHVSQIMLAGSTGDGWELADDAFDALIDFAAREDLPAGTRILFGVLRGSTEDVIARLRHLEGRVAAGDLLAERFCGVAICPPIDAEADQDSILAHFDAAFAASECPVAVYQLPQVTGCRIAPETMAKLAANSRVTMFKDSSGEDTVANDRPGYDGVVMVRGAEGGYLEALAPEGSYNGWLLSTGNALGGPLREVLRLREEGKRDEAAHLSGMVSEAVAALFSAAASETGANAFSNANRAMDHLRAYGRGWRDAPSTLKVDGNPLSSGLIAEAEKHAGDLLELSESGYMQAGMR